jgi:hypothetical protein
LKKLGGERPSESLYSSCESSHRLEEVDEGVDGGAQQTVFTYVTSLKTTSGEGFLEIQLKNGDLPV